MIVVKKVQFCEKRDGTRVIFEKTKIVNAIDAAFQASGEGNKIIAQQVTEAIMENIMRVRRDRVPTIEDIQDLVINTLIDYNFRKTVIEYINYRENRKRERLSS